MNRLSTIKHRNSVSETTVTEYEQNSLARTIMNISDKIFEAK